MAITIRLARQGAKKRPQYQVVVMNARDKRDGGALDRIGYYFPKAEKKADKLQINQESLQKWLSVGAQPTETLGQLIKSASK